MPKARRTYQSRPTIHDVLTDPFVCSKLREAWRESNPDAPKVRVGEAGSIKREHGGWVVWNRIAGVLEVARVAPGTRDGLASIVGTRPTDNEKQEVVAWFHTHPNRVSEGYASDPSPADIAWQSAEAKVPGIVETHDGRRVIPYLEDL